MVRCTSSSSSLSLPSYLTQSKDLTWRKSSRLRGRFSRRSFPVASIKFNVEDVADVLQNKVLISSVVACTIGQLSKPFTSALRGDGFDLSTVVRSGGMPSSHSAGVTAATTCLGLERGFSDPIFGMSAVFATFVMYDAQGVRREVGRHAKNLNRIIARDREKSTIEGKRSPVKVGSFDSLSGVDQAGDYEELLSRQSTDSYLDGLSGRAESAGGALEESVGHDEVQVVAGAILGLLVSLAVETLIN